MNGQMSEGQNFTSIQVDWANMQKVFLKDTLQLTGMEVSLNRVPPGEGSPYRHKHKQNEELFIFVKGSGQLQVDGKIINVQEGTSIRVAPDGVRAIRNNSFEDLYYICIQAKEGSLTVYTKTDGIITDKTVEW
jgi:mannose-6-phosphate isomerase-like protein (cupin superfamily)